jgi:hypothetical protein
MHTFVQLPQCRLETHSLLLLLLLLLLASCTAVRLLPSKPWVLLLPCSWQDASQPAPQLPSGTALLQYSQQEATAAVR